MITHNLVQRSPEWHAHRLSHHNASDAPAMLGVSTKKTRSELLQELHTGLAREFSDYVQERVIDPGHQFEAQARPLAELIIGEDLYPVVGSDGKYSASFDGITMSEEITWEHKRLNAELRACMPPNGVPFDGGVELPAMYCVQLEQQLMVSRAKRALFMASEWDGETLVEERHCWYEPDLALRAQIVAGWEQFEADLAAYTPPEAAVAVVAAAVTALPAVSVQVSGAIVVRDNFKTFETALRDFIDTRLIREPSTDQDFADLDLQIKALKSAESALESAEAQMLSQVASVDEAKRTKDMLLKLARDNRLMAEKLLDARKAQIKSDVVTGATTALKAHITTLNERIGNALMPLVPADFVTAAKNKRTLASLRDAVDTELARAKIAANEIADRITVNLRALDERKEYSALFPDVGALVLKARDDLAAVISSRVSDHKAREAARLEAETNRIRAEEQAKAQREAEAKAAQQAAADAQARREREAAEQAGQSAPSPAPAPAPAPAQPPSVVRFQRPAAAPAANEPATLKLGTICERLGFTVTAAFVSDSLGIQHSPTDKTAKLYRESDWPRICAALIEHITTVAELQAA